MTLRLKVKILFAQLLTKIWVKIFGLKVNCLLTRYPLVWLNPDFKDCINLCLLREHGYHVTVKEGHSSNEAVDTHHIIHKPTKEFGVLLTNVISIAEKDLLEF